MSAPPEAVHRRYDMSVKAKNPILSGFYPDPSICGVGEDFYLVNSTFSYFPGLPVMHSRDLAHWEQIGNVMERESQLPLKNSGHSQGLFAPTIRYHRGTYYVVCTNVSHRGNYIVTAQDPAGPWSEPYYLEGADGIDPSLFFDDDGKCYYIGTHPNPQGCRYNGDYYIWIREVDLENMKLTGETYNVWNGAMKDIVWPEGPHLYKRNGWYYIMNAEGGTGPEHAVTICRSRNLTGPYENNFCNPIITHRHLGRKYPIRYVGHGDLVETAKGEWYMVMLAVRPLEGYTTMGRETFLAKVEWENDWPVVNPGVGILTEEVEIDLPPWMPEGGSAVTGERSYDFAGMEKPGPEFLTLRNPGEDMFRLVKGEGLALSFRDITLKEKDSPSYVAVRQQDHRFEAGALLRTGNLTEGRRAGIALMQSDAFHLRAELFREGDRLGAEVILCRKGEDQTISRVELPDRGEASLNHQKAELVLRVEGLQAFVELLTAREGSKERTERSVLCGNVDIRALSTEVAGGFVGCTVGMYAVAQWDQRDQAAMFERFSYRALRG